MRGYEAESSIAAPPEDVWAILTDVSAWPDWDSGVTGVDGGLVVGEKITISVQANPGRAFPLTVAELTPPTQPVPGRMVFRGGMPLGLFTGRRTYTLTAEDGGTRFTMREQFTGPLAGLIFKTIPDLGPSFRQFATGLKHRVETPS